MFTKEPVPKEHFLKKNRPQSEKWDQKEPTPMVPMAKREEKKMKTQKITLKSKIDNLELECFGVKIDFGHESVEML